MSMSVSVVAASSRIRVDCWACCSHDSVSRFFPRLWLIACRVVVINRVILGCDGTLCLYPFAPAVASVRARFSVFRVAIVS